MKESLLKSHEMKEIELTEKELNALKTFHASSGWCAKATKDLEWRSIRFCGEAGSVDHEKALTMYTIVMILDYFTSFCHVMARSAKVTQRRNVAPKQ